MRTPLFFLGLTLGMAPAFAQPAASSVVTPGADRPATGDTAQILAVSDQLVLPPDGQVVRPFATTRLTLHLETKPVLGLDVQTWPVLELGLNALVFARDAAGGKIIFVPGDNEPVETPFGFALDEKGQALAPIQVDIRETNGSIDLEINGKAKNFHSVATERAGEDLVLSAGGENEWKIENLIVSADFSPAAAASLQSRASSADKTGAKKAAPISLSSSVAAGLALSSETSANSTGKDSVGKATQPASELTLEIFTPPSTRFGRAEAVRNAVAEKLAR